MWELLLTGHLSGLYYGLSACPYYEYETNRLLNDLNILHLEQWGIVKETLSEYIDVAGIKDLSATIDAEVVIEATEELLELLYNETIGFKDLHVRLELDTGAETFTIAVMRGSDLVGDGELSGDDYVEYLSQVTGGDVEGVALDEQSLSRINSKEIMENL